MSKYLYWLTDRMERDDAYVFDSEAQIPKRIAQDAAEDYHSEHDRRECSWPVTLTVVMANEVERTFEVDRGVAPAFCAREAVDK